MCGVSVLSCLYLHNVCLAVRMFICMNVFYLFGLSHECFLTVHSTLRLRVAPGAGRPPGPRAPRAGRRRRAPVCVFVTVRRPCMVATHRNTPSFLLNSIYTIIYLYSLNTPFTAQSSAEASAPSATHNKTGTYERSQRRAAGFSGTVQSSSLPREEAAAACC